MKQHWLIEYLENELPKEMTLRMKEHLSNNPNDSLFVEKLRSIKEDLRLLSNEKIDEIFERRKHSLEQKIMNRIKEDHPKKKSLAVIENKLQTWLLNR